MPAKIVKKRKVSSAKKRAVLSKYKVNKMRAVLISFQKRENSLKRYSDFRSKQELNFWKNLPDSKVIIWYNKFFE